MSEVTDTCHSYKPVMCMHEYVCAYVRVYDCVPQCGNALSDKRSLLEGLHHVLHVLDGRNAALSTFAVGWTDCVSGTHWQLCTCRVSQDWCDGLHIHPHPHPGDRVRPSVNLHD